MKKLTPFNLQHWIDEHRSLLKPPVNNKVIWTDSDYIVMVIGGPNQRTDFHVNEGEELFYQLEGDIILRIMDQGKPRDIPIKQGEMLMLPGLVPHSPQRFAGTVGLVVELKRKPEQKDGFQWYCPACNAKIYEEFFPVSRIEVQLSEVFQRFYSDPQKHNCQKCGQIFPVPKKD